MNGKILFWLLCLILLFADGAYAIKDFIIIRNASLYRAVTEGYPSLKENIPASDDFGNIFVYTEHFRIITGDNIPPSVVDFVQRLKIYIEEVWEKEVEELGFHSPENSDRYFIDVYIANTGAYNPVYGEDVTISSYYAGYATFYPDGTPFFVINPSISDDILKATIAHEFFHTIQFFYLSDYLENFSYDDMWWLEASAVWMEFVVFPEVNDFVNYVNNWIETSYMDITTFNHYHEYGTSSFLIYLYYKFSIETVKFVKDSFEKFGEYQHFINYVENGVENYFTKTFSKVLLELISCVYSRENSCFPFMEYLQTPPVYSYESPPEVGTYGVFLLENVTSQFNEYDELPFIAFNFNQESIGVVAKTYMDSVTLKSFLANVTEDDRLSLHSGWNLIANPFNVELSNSSEVFNDYVLWIFKDNRWTAWSDNEYINDVLRQIGVLSENHTIPALSGFWIKLSEDLENPFYNGESILEKKQTVSLDWMLITFGRLSIPVSDLGKVLDNESSNFIMWSYENDKWKFYSSDSLINSVISSYGVELIDEVGRGKGYWIKKID
ncbi:hypothetical protein [Desulfurobacterium crinifex]